MQVPTPLDPSCLEESRVKQLNVVILKVLCIDFVACNFTDLINSNSMCVYGVRVYTDSFVFSMCNKTMTLLGLQRWLREHWLFF